MGIMMMDIALHHTHHVDFLTHLYLFPLYLIAMIHHHIYTSNNSMPYPTSIPFKHHDPLSSSTSPQLLPIHPSSDANESY
jgi:hypothetical protein